MWLAGWAAAGVPGYPTLPSAIVALAAMAEAAGDGVPTSTIVAGLIALVSAALAAWLGARGTLRTADVQREQAFDKRFDDRLAKSEEEREKALDELHRYREMYADLRVRVIGAGLDPDNLPVKGVPSGEPP